MLIDNFTPGQGVISVPCQGKQTIEAGHKLYFLPAPVCLHRASYFYRFRPGFLTGITFPTTGPAMKNDIALCLAQVCKLKGLTRLDLVNCADVSDEVLPSIDNCPDLTDLALNANFFTVKNLAKTKIINRLNTLTYTYADLDIAETVLKTEEWDKKHEGRHRGEHHRRNGKGHHDGDWEHHDGDFGDHDEWDKHKTLDQEITPLLEALAKSPNLTWLEMPNVPLHPKDVETLSQIKNLQVIDLSNSNIMDANVETLSKMPNLVVFHVDNCVIDAGAIPAFKKMASHSLKFIYMRSIFMNQETVKLYRKELPGVQINQ